MIIKVDYREKKLISLIKAKLGEQKNISIIVEDLPIGDIIICDDECIEKIIIERKSLNDLAASIRDGRYTEQSFRLNGNPIHNHNIVYLIEGDIHRYSSKYSKISKNTLQVTTFCINYFKGFSIMKTRDILETAEYILLITDKLNREKVRANYYSNTDNTTTDSKRYSEVVSKVKKENIRPDNIGEIILSQIPGISSNSALAIMENFSSLYKLLTALEADGKCLDNIVIKTNKSSRRISQKIITNIKKFLLHNVNSSVIKINT
jgi:ERCC4-type nuclease